MTPIVALLALFVLALLIWSFGDARRIKTLEGRVKALETVNADHRLEALNGRVSQLELRR